jgi:hypothetical protein
MFLSVYPETKGVEMDAVFGEGINNSVISLLKLLTALPSIELHVKSAGLGSAGERMAFLSSPQRASSSSYPPKPTISRTRRGWFDRLFNQSKEDTSYQPIEDQELARLDDGDDYEVLDHRETEQQ